MASNLSPPPIQIPTDFVLDKTKYAFFNALLNAIYKMWTTLFNIRIEHRKRSTFGSGTLIESIRVKENRTILLETKLVGRCLGGSVGSPGDSAYFLLTGCFKNINGAVTQVGSTVIEEAKDVSAWGARFIVRGDVIEIAVTGVSGDELAWEGSTYVHTVGA